MNKGKIKVCHVTSVHPAKDGRIFYKECTSLAKAGYDVTLVAAGAENETCNNVKIVGVPITGSGRFNRVFKLDREVYKAALAVDADIYHLHDPELLLFALKLKKHGKKVIFDSHEFIGEQIKTKDYIPRILRNTISFFYKEFEKYICKRIDAVIQICTIKGMDYFKDRCKKSVFITNAPILNTQVDFIPRLEKDSTKVVHIGGLTYDRGITFLAQAIAKTQATLNLAGTFEPQDLQFKVQDICGDKLVYHGFVPHNKISDILLECNIATCTLLYRGQYEVCDIIATKMYEYMWFGLPIIMSDFPFLRQFNNKYKIGICVRPDSPQEISKAIQYLMDNPKEAQEMGKNGRDAIIKYFNWSIEEKKLLLLYASL